MYCILKGIWRLQHQCPCCCLCSPWRWVCCPVLRSSTTTMLPLEYTNRPATPRTGGHQPGHCQWVNWGVSVLDLALSAICICSKNHTFTPMHACTHTQHNTTQHNTTQHNTTQHTHNTTQHTHTHRDWKKVLTIFVTWNQFYIKQDNYWQRNR